MNALETIQSARTDGEGAAIAYIREYGIEAAKAYARQLCETEKNPSPAMYGYIDGFMNGVVKA